MKRLKITFRKEVEVDLNTYYGSFKPALRRAIDEALYELLGGEAPKGSSKKSAKGAKKAMLLRRTDKKPIKPNSRIAALLGELTNKDYLWSDLEELCVQKKLDPKSAVHGLIASGYLKTIGEV